MSEPFGLLAEAREVPLELESGGIEPLLPDSPLVLGLFPFLTGPTLDFVDPGLELLFAGHARQQGGVEAIPVGAEHFQFVSPLGEPQPIRLPLPEFGAEPIPLARIRWSSPSPIAPRARSASAGAEARGSLRTS